MTPSDEKLPQDERLSHLYRSMHQDEPSPLLDARIRRQARRELRRRYWPPLAAAAVIVLGITVALRIFDVEQPALQPDDLQPSVDSATKAAPAMKSRAAAPATARPEAEFLQPQTSDSSPPRFDLEASKQQVQRSAPVPYRLQQQAGSPQLADEAEMRMSGSPCGQADLQHNADPDAWRQRIRELRDKGHTQTAECLLKLLTQRFDSD